MRMSGVRPGSWVVKCLAQVASWFPEAAVARRRRRHVSPAMKLVVALAMTAAGDAHAPQSALAACLKSGGQYEQVRSDNAPPGCKRIDCYFKTCHADFNPDLQTRSACHGLTGTCCGDSGMEQCPPFAC